MTLPNDMEVNAGFVPTVKTWPTKPFRTSLGANLRSFAQRSACLSTQCSFMRLEITFFGAFSFSCSLFLQESFTIISLVGVKLYCELIVSVCFCMHYIYIHCWILHSLFLCLFFCFSFLLHFCINLYQMAKCHGCKNQGSLKESLVWDGTTRHFCNLTCLLQFCSKCITPHQPASNGTSPSSSICKTDLKPYSRATSWPCV